MKEILKNIFLSLFTLQNFMTTAKYNKISTLWIRCFQYPSEYICIIKFVFSAQAWAGSKVYYYIYTRIKSSGVYPTKLMA